MATERGDVSAKAGAALNALNALTPEQRQADAAKYGADWVVAKVIRNALDEAGQRDKEAQQKISKFHMFSR